MARYEPNPERRPAIVTGASSGIGRATAMLLASLAIGTSLVRRHVLGQETSVPRGPGNYRVTLLVRGEAVT